MNKEQLEDMCYKISILTLNGWKRDCKGRWFRLGMRHLVKDRATGEDVSSPYWTFEEAWEWRADD